MLMFTPSFSTEKLVLSDVINQEVRKCLGFVPLIETGIIHPSCLCGRNAVRFQ